MRAFAFLVLLMLAPVRAVAGPFMPEGGAVLAPAGYRAFCAAAGGRCDGDRSPGGPARRWTKTARAEIVAVNRAVNRMMSPASEHGDIWRETGAFGDCEDYALAKRRMLLALGWRAGQALIAIGETPDGAAHAVLVIRTDAGDFTLDNRSNRIVRWDRSDLRWVARQSARLPALWVGVGGDKTD